VAQWAALAIFSLPPSSGNSALAVAVMSMFTPFINKNAAAVFRGGNQFIRVRRST
jgi:hypothetical protein